LRLLEDWTVPLKKFRQNYTNSVAESNMDGSPFNLPARQLQELLKLHSGTNINKILINLQLAATHVAFMVQKQTRHTEVDDNFIGHS
jgi:hypothetical protein